MFATVWCDTPIALAISRSEYPSAWACATARRNARSASDDRRFSSRSFSRVTLIAPFASARAYREVRVMVHAAGDSVRTRCRVLRTTILLLLLEQATPLDPSLDDGALLGSALVVELYRSITQCSRDGRMRLHLVSPRSCLSS